jgi:hypothetical protein
MKDLINQLLKLAPSHKPFVVFGLWFEKGSDQPIGEDLEPLLTNVNFNEVGKSGNVTDDLLLDVGRLTRSQVGIVGTDEVFATVLLCLEYIPPNWLGIDEGFAKEDPYYDILAVELLECQKQHDGVFMANFENIAF